MISKFKKSKWTSTLLAVILIITVAAVGLTGCKKSSDVITNNPSDTTDSTNTTEDELTPDTTTPSEDTTEVDETNDQSNSNSDPAQSNDNTAEDTQNGSNTLDPGQDQGSSADDSVVYYGDWVINKVLAYGSAGTYSKEDAEALVGKELSFTADQATSFGDDPSLIETIVSEPVYSETVITSREFVANYRMTLDNLGIKADSIPEITITDTDGTVGNFLLKDENTLILVGGGTYFELTRKAQ